ncbi:MAG: hypothetical protein HN337_06025 [Deltaproteobacteria bacterium]|jgi:hypothetical protein|nr:hypothetical protein [Deltaproteobacteria bacterium]
MYAIPSHLTIPAPITSALGFHFLSKTELPSAESAYRAIQKITKCTKFPSAVLFDIDRTLYIEPTDELSGRMVGALLAFHNAGIPVGLFSLRYELSVETFVGMNPSIAQILSRDHNGQPLIYGNQTVIDHYVGLCEGLKRVRLRIDHKRSYVDPSVVMRIPILEIQQGEDAPMEILAPKLPPFPGALVIDDKNYSIAYRMLIGALQKDNDDGESRLLQVAEMSLHQFWHVDESLPQGDFSSSQLQSLKILLQNFPDQF